jgi:putative CocE/NonD family hydrolase
MHIRETYYTVSDGVRLYTRIILPSENKKLPIVFIRTPYEQPLNGEPYPAENYQNNLFLKNGYAIIIQHVRGTGDSEGECRPYYERQDGLDTLEIIRKEPFYNGEIYLTGGSYLATVHLCYLSTNPRDIKAAALSIQRDQMLEHSHYNGMCKGYCSISWFLRMVKKSYTPKIDYSDALYRPYEKIIERIIGKDIPIYTNKLLNTTYNDFWKNQENDHVADNLTIPVLFSEGWFDFYVDGMFSMWKRLPEKTKQKSAFVVGPWGHATKVKDSEYEFENGNLPDEYIVEFFNSVRDNTEYKYLELGKVNYYSVGGNFWTTASSFSNKNINLYFNGDNTLSEKPGIKGEISYKYDPDKPLNYYKYNNIFKAPEKGVTDGVLSFESEPFEAEVNIYGEIKWNMKVKTDCDDTAFFMRVYFVENGIAYNITQTITSLSHIKDNYIAGEECIINISTPPVGFTLKKGNSIRVDISSHSDLFVPHSNTLGHWAKVTETKVATNTIICDNDSRIQLPMK